MQVKKHIDIKVVNGAWQVDAGQQPTQCSDLYSISQDIKHSIMESGLQRELVAERNAILRADVLVQIEQLTELDTRVVPGSATATEIKPGQVQLTAKAYGYESQIKVLA